MLIEVLNEVLIKMSFEVLIEVLFEVLIEVLIDGLMGFSPGCIQRWYVRCTGEFSVMSESCIWRWNDQVHWRVFDDVRKVAFWWSNALAGFRYCQRAAPDAEAVRCTDGFDDDVRRAVSDSEAVRYTDGFSIYFAVSTTNVVTRFLTVWWRRQAVRQTGEMGRKQTGRRQGVKSETVLAGC